MFNVIVVLLSNEICIVFFLFCFLFSLLNQFELFFAKTTSRLESLLTAAAES